MSSAAADTKTGGAKPEEKGAKPEEKAASSWADTEDVASLSSGSLGASGALGASGGIYNSGQSFEKLGLPEQVCKNVFCELQFTVLSKIQAESLPIILGSSRPHFLGQSQAGSGKTVAYGLAIMCRVDKAEKATQALCLVPTREIANQVHDVLIKLSKNTGISIRKAIPEEPRGRVSEQVVVGTPGTIIAKIKHHELDPKTIIIFVCDEADRMIAQGGGLGEQTMQIKRHCTNKLLQVLLFSATFPDNVSKFAAAIAPNAATVRVKNAELSLEHVRQFLVETTAENKYKTLTQLYGLLQIGQSLVFVETIRSAKELTNLLRKDGHGVSLIYGKDMSAADRDRIMLEFATGKTTVLVATNVLARGVDVPAVNLVVNYELPTIKHRNGTIKPDFETYCHRVGRAGRFGRKGAAISLSSSDADKQHLDAIAKFFRKPIQPLPDVAAVRAHLAKPT